ncbi:MAG: YbjN domain-containing protein [Gallionellaceae bacterium]|nr:YbjN domain-containing protein [Gallionellaceae bacterium]
MKTIAEVVEQWAAEKWSEPTFKQDADGDGAALSFIHESNCGDFNGYLEISNANDLLVMYLYAPRAISEKSLVPVMDAIARINEGMVVGCVEIVRKKEILLRFRAGIDVEDGNLSDTMLDNLLGVAVSTVERYIPAILSICFAGMTPEQAVARAREEAVEDCMAEKLNLDVEQNQPLPESVPYSSPALTAWANELAQAISTVADADTWRMVGHGAIVVHDDMERACEMLRRVAVQANMHFVRFESDEVFDIPDGMGDPLTGSAPILAYFEPGDWMRKIDSDTSSEEAENIHKFRKSLAIRMEAFEPEHPVIYATSAYRLEDVTSILRKRELFDRYFHIPKLTPVMLGKEFISLFGEENCDASIISFPGKVGQLLGDEFDNERLRRLAALNMARLAKRENRKLAFIDLVGMVTAGLGDSDEAAKDNEVPLRHTAIHEAGHAAMAVIDSNGKNTPEYSTIVAHRDSKGLVLESISYSFARGDLFTYADFRHKIRISLAGRAAEEVALGLDWISSGSSADLENSSKLASRAFAYWGFAPGMNDAETSASNLAVVRGDPSPSENLHNEMLVRKFLADEYRNTVRILREHRPLLDTIAERLMRDSVLEQHEIAELYAAHMGQK